MFAIGGGGILSSYMIQKSLRFRASAGAYLSRTPGSASNRTTWTWSAWVKRGALNGTYQILFGAIPTGSNYTMIGFNTTEGITVWEYPTVSTVALATTPAYRDSASFLHLVLAYDTTQATASNRIRLYVNGIEVTAFATDNRASVTQNLNGTVNNNVAHVIGSEDPTTHNYFFDGIMTEVNFIDGQQLTPSSFGQIDSTSGAWSPKKYGGTYGTNGFYLPFSDNSGLTSGSNAGLGKDFSGNTNYWNTNNFSLTAGSTYDSFTDVPTLTSANASNFAVLNPVKLPAAGGVTLSDGNLKMTTGASGAQCRALSSLGMTTGKWYCEYTALDASTLHLVGIALETDTPELGYIGSSTGSYGYYAANGNKYNNSSSTGYGASWNNTNVIGVAFDADAHTLTFYKDNTSQGVAYSSIPAGTYYFGQGDYTSSYIGCFNFGQRPFAYTPPSGYLALNSYNMALPSITNGAMYMDATTYTGNGTTQTVVNSTGMQPDLIWIKDRDAANNHVLVDSVRGPGGILYSQSTVAEITGAAQVSSINTNGFSLGTSTYVNESGHKTIGWQWKKGAAPGFDIIAYTGNATNRTISHALGVAPKFIIIKDRTSASYNWIVYHSYTTASGYMLLSTTAAYAADASTWNSTAPTSSVFSIGTGAWVNNSGDNYIAYLWSEIPGFSKFGNYTGNGSTDGPFVYCGFRPKFIMLKRTDSTGDWVTLDTSRNIVNDGTEYGLSANLTAAEGSVAFDMLSNGFKIRTTSASVNTSTATHLYIAFAETPFKYALAR